MRTYSYLLALPVFSVAILLAQTAPKPATGAKPAAQASSKSTSRGNVPSQATVDAFLQHAFGWNPNIKWKVSEIKPSAEDPTVAQVTVVLSSPQGQQMTRLYITPNQKFAISGDVMPFGTDPYGPAREELNHKATGPSKGAAQPAVTIVEFGDFQCPSCKKAQPTIEKLLSETPNARLVFQEFPLVQIHKWAMIAAKYGECVAKQNTDQFWKYSDLVYNNQETLEPMEEADVIPHLKDYVKQAGADVDKATACTADPAIATKISNSLELGKDLDVNGTPTLFIGGRKVSDVNGTPYEILKALTDFQATPQGR